MAEMLLQARNNECNSPVAVWCWNDGEQGVCWTALSNRKEGWRVRALRASQSTVGTLAFALGQVGATCRSEQRRGRT